MDLDNLKQILELVREHDLSEFEIEHEGLKLKIRKDAARGASSAPAVPPIHAHSVALALGDLGRITLKEGDAEEAFPLFRKSLRELLALKDTAGAALAPSFCRPSYHSMFHRKNGC